MADFDWSKLIGAGIGAVSNAAASQREQQGISEGNKLLEDAYLRAIKMLEGGQLGYTPTTATGIQRPVGDQGAMAAQQDALYKLQEAARSGYSTMDKAAINAAINQTNQNARGQREAILSRMDPRSGAALAAQMQAQQGAANQASQQAMDIAAGSRAKALAALGQYGNLASNMRGQEFKEQNAIDQFNADIGRWNAGQVNQARGRTGDSQLRALEVAGGAGGNLARGLDALGKAGAAGISSTGSSLSGAAKLWGTQKDEEPKPDNGTDPAPYYIRRPEYD